MTAGPGVSPGRSGHGLGGVLVLPQLIPAARVQAEGDLLGALPREDIRDVEKLRRFIDRVSKIAPDATGRPVA